MSAYIVSAQSLENGSPQMAISKSACKAVRWAWIRAAKAFLAVIAAASFSPSISFSSRSRFNSLQHYSVFARNEAIHIYITKPGLPHCVRNDKPLYTFNIESMCFFNALRAVSISALVVLAPKLNRKVVLARAVSLVIVCTTVLAPPPALLQALLVEIAIPATSRVTTANSLSMPGIEILILFSKE